MKLVGLPIFGGDMIHVNFRWPTQSDIDKLGLNEPLKLKEIRTKVQKQTLRAIQFVFQNGIESPLITTDNS